MHAASDLPESDAPKQPETDGGLKEGTTDQKTASNDANHRSSRSSRRSDWVQDPKELERFNKWHPVVHEKERGLPLLASEVPDLPWRVAETPEIKLPKDCNLIPYI